MLERTPVPSDRKAFIASHIAQISEEQLLGHLESLVGVRHPVTAPEGLRAGGAYIAGQMKSFGLDLLEETIEGEHNERFVNLIGRESGGRSGKKILVIGAHYDTVAESPGADDNASGLAVMLEMARILAPLRGKLTPQFVAFSLEEEGFWEAITTRGRFAEIRSPSGGR
ncbi:MAG: M28 family peptidase [Candidatus Manganitrophus sp.]|nr:MAG: M28 family peptidase [Candidatus Manganitrophus sp.]